jgi:hypothetical protein
MQMTKLRTAPTLVPFALGIVAVLALAFAVVPLAIAASSGSSYPMEVIRAHTVYKVIDPASPTVLGLGVHGNL